jgi:hypothetical protein
MLTTVGRYFSYLYCGRNELDIVSSVFDFDKANKPRGPVVPLIILISIVFGLLIAFATNMYLYSLLYIILSIADLYGQGIVNQNISMLIIKNYIKEEHKQSNKLKAMYYFFVEKPLLVHAASFIIMACISVLLTFFGKYEDIKYLIYISYAVFIFTNIIGELVIWRWRNIREKMYSGDETSL